MRGELTASKRLLPGAVRDVGIPFDCLVVDGLYLGAPFLQLADDRGFPVGGAFDRQLPELCEAAQARLRDRPPTMCQQDEKGERIELWTPTTYNPGTGWTGPLCA